jgi:hypothetical protein
MTRPEELRSIVLTTMLRLSVRHGSPVPRPANNDNTPHRQTVETPA